MHEQTTIVNEKLMFKFYFYNTQEDVVHEKLFLHFKIIAYKWVSNYFRENIKNLHEGRSKNFNAKNILITNHNITLDILDIFFLICLWYLVIL